MLPSPLRNFVAELDERRSGEAHPATRPVEPLTFGIPGTGTGGRGLGQPGYVSGGPVRRAPGGSSVAWAGGCHTWTVSSPRR